MKKPGPVICRRTSTYHAAQARKPGPKCGRCGAAVVSRSDLVGWLDDAPLCGDCLTAEAPPLGWALQLVEVAALALGGRWPRQAENRELPILLELVRGTRAAVGPLEHRNPRIPLALDLFDVIGRRDGGEVCLKVLEVLDVAGRAGGGALAAELLDVARHHGGASPARDPGEGTTAGRAARRRVAGRMDALREQLAAWIRRKGADVEPPEDPELGELLEILDRIGVKPGAFFAEVWPSAEVETPREPGKAGER